MVLADAEAVAVVVGRTEKCPRQKKIRQLLRPWNAGWIFQEGLTSDKRKFPIQQFKAFWAVLRSATPR
jgi:hypothetical protein